MRASRELFQSSLKHQKTKVIVDGIEDIIDHCPINSIIKDTNVQNNKISVTQRGNPNFTLN